MKYFGRFTGKRVRLLAAAALLLLAAGVYVGPQIAAAIETGGKHPGETDPFASGKTLLKGDSLITVRTSGTGEDGGDRGTSHVAYVTALSPDASASGGKEVVKYNGESRLCLDGGLGTTTEGFYTAYAPMRLHSDETSYMLQAVPVEGNIRLFAYKADKLAVNDMSTAGSRKLDYKLADHADSPRAIGLFSGQWTAGDARDVVAASVSRVSDKLYLDVSRLRDIQADASGMLTAASGDVHTRFEFAAARSLDKLVVECAAGDADGDGIQELAFLSDENTDGYYRLRLYKVSGDQFVQAAEIKTDLAYHDTANTKKRIGISFGDVKGEGREQLLVAGYARDKDSYDSGKWGLHWRLYAYEGAKLTEMDHTDALISHSNRASRKFTFAKACLPISTATEGPTSS